MIVPTDAKRIAFLRFNNGEDAICNLLVSKADLPHGLFRKSKIIDRNTGKEVVIVSDPVRVITQMNLNDGITRSLLAPFVAQSNQRFFPVIVDTIVGIYPASEQALGCYEEFLKRGVQPLPKPETKEKKGEETKNTRFLSPESNIQH